MAFISVEYPAACFRWNWPEP